MKEGKYISLILVALALIVLSIGWLGWKLYQSGSSTYIETVIQQTPGEHEVAERDYEGAFRSSLRRADSLAQELNKELIKLKMLQTGYENKIDSGLPPNPGSTFENDQQIGKSSGMPAANSDDSSKKYAKRPPAKNDLVFRSAVMRACVNRNGDRSFIDQAKLVNEMLIELDINGNPSSNQDVYFVLFQPDGTVLKPTETGGIFKPGNTWYPYTKKVSAACNRGNGDSCIFSINYARFRPGIHILHVYYLNVIVARVVCVLR